MYSTRFLCVTALASILHYVSAVTLEPIPPPPRIVDKRAANAALDLQSSEVFLWGARDAAAIANFTVFMPRDEENILSMERFSGMLTSVECTNTSLTLGFKDDETFLYAQRVWDWVNGADNHTFLMVAGAGECHWNQFRQPYAVHDIGYDEVGNIAHLNATAQTWQAAVHTWDLKVGHIPDQDESLTRRFLDVDKTKDFSMDLAHAFPFTAKFTTPEGISIGVECTKNCASTGTLEFEAHLRAGLFSGLDEASIKVVPKNISATVETKFFVGGKLNKPWEKKYPIATIPLSGLHIPGIASFGPELAIEAGFGVNALEGQLSVTTGAKASVSDASVAYFDLANPSNRQFSGWAPTIDRLPTQVSAKIQTGLTVFINTGAQLVAEVLGQGWKVGLNFKAPAADLTLAAVESPTGNACAGTNATRALTTQVDIGARFDIEAGKSDGSSLFFSVPLFDLPRKTFGPWCQGF